jgi:hypothetical protein
MQAIPEEYLRMVVFLCVNEEHQGNIKRIPKATGFFVRVPIEGASNKFLDYIITARHCIEEAQKYHDLFIRMNCKTGKFVEFPTKTDKWFRHDSADVAAIPFVPDFQALKIEPANLDFGSYRINDTVGGSPDYKYKGESEFGKIEIKPSTGHQVYFLGLFTQHHGLEHNMPIARFGHISQIPTTIDMVINETKISIIAYLMEFQSWGGHSGSPVFFLYPTIVQTEIPLINGNGKRTGIPKSVDLIWISGLIGLVSGHYDIKKEAQKTGDIGEIQIDQNSGIAIVTPSESITQLLMRDDLKENRIELFKKAKSN